MKQALYDRDDLRFYYFYKFRYFPNLCYYKLFAILVFSMIHLDYLVKIYLAK